MNRICKELHATDLYDCPKCGVKLRDFRQELRVKVDAVPIEKKQQLLNELKSHNVGEAIKIVDPQSEIDDLVWFTIISDQIETHEYSTFNFKAK